MWDALAAVLGLSREVARLREDVNKLQQGVRDLSRAVERMQTAMQFAAAHQEERMKNLGLELENKMLKFEKRLPPARPGKRDESRRARASRNTRSRGWTAPGVLDFGSGANSRERIIRRNCPIIDDQAAIKAPQIPGTAAQAAGDLARLELSFLDLLHELDAARRDRRVIEPFEAQHRVLTTFVGKPPLSLG